MSNFNLSEFTQKLKDIYIDKLTVNIDIVERGPVIWDKIRSGIETQIEGIIEAATSKKTNYKIGELCHEDTIAFLYWGADKPETSCIKLVISSIDNFSSDVYYTWA